MEASERGDAERQRTHRRRATNRNRVVLACQRCQRRKQKCDGTKPTCMSCSRHSLQCTYVEPVTTSAGERRLYIKALEQRVADLESELSALGQQGAGEDHLRHEEDLDSAQAGAAFHTSTSPQPSSAADVFVEHTYRVDDERNEIVIAVRDLSLSASGHYVGASSHINVGRILSSMVGGEQRSPTTVADGATLLDGGVNPAPKSVHNIAIPNDAVEIPQLSALASERLYQGWFQHIATRYPVLHTPKVRWLYENRAQLTEDYDKSILYLIFAVSGRWLESAGETGYFYSDQHFELALARIDQIIQFRDERTIDYLILLALYCTRAPKDPGAWTYVGVAMRLCIDLGLHRSRRNAVVGVTEELNKRRFWTTYCLDRDISIAIGRPLGISDHDIDAGYPLDIDEDTNTDAEVRRACQQQVAGRNSTLTTLTPFIHRLHLKRIKSEIQHEVYRVDANRKASSAAIDGFLQQLDDWKHTVPVEAWTYVHDTNETKPYDGMEFFSIHYHRCVRFLLYPQLYHRPVNIHWLQRCAEACKGVIFDYRSLHLNFPVGFSSASIQSVFLAGLTLFYCAWLAPVDLLSDLELAFTDCQLLLYVISERYPSARRYRDIFERIKREGSYVAGSGSRMPGQALPNNVDLGQDIAMPTESWPGTGDDFERMLFEMTGQDIDGMLFQQPLPMW